MWCIVLHHRKVIMKIISVIRKRTAVNCLHLMIMGDMNYSHKNWQTSVSMAPADDSSNLFLKCCQDEFLYQHVQKPTHYLSNQTANILDIILTNDEAMVQEIHFSEPLGRSPHFVLNWHYMIYAARNVSKAFKYCYEKLCLYAWKKS